MSETCTVKMDASKKMVVAIFRKSGTNPDPRMLTNSTGTVMTLPPIEVIIGTGTDTKLKACIPNMIMCADGFHPDRSSKSCEMICIANTSATGVIYPPVTTTGMKLDTCSPVALRCTVGYHVEQTPGTCDVSCMPDLTNDI